MDARTSAERFQQAFCREHQLDLHWSVLFDHLPNAAFFIKDPESRFIRANQRLIQILNCQHEWEVIGKSDLDFRPRQVAMVYIEEDLQVMTGTADYHRSIQMVPDVGGVVAWYVTTKTPLRQPSGAICGVMGVMYETREFAGMMPGFQAIEPALRHIHSHLKESITTQELAARVHLSERQFVRRFKEVMGETPMRHLVRQRIRMACQDLMATQASAGQIGLAYGFYDQSAFTRAFHHITGETPTAYRQRHRTGEVGRNGRT